ncbi:EP300-interacting inhibitor of differentiation 3-like [Leptopilina boulardi]|uniref:EP300-interacting inhibitor of differentiation 3-like n=1 Tax=Leptopilina boulardi TaxID=63433 RepID=UPI0021F52082|nr:EP300-interacting inhibitor of differentiation 3-like [Leptopilina boulardi]
MSQVLSPVERKQVLGRYLTRARALKDSIGSKTLINLNDVTEKEDAVMDETSLEEKIENQVEVILDSEIVTCISKIIEQCTVTLLKDVNTYNYEEYAEMIHDYVQQQSDTIADEPENLNWADLEIDVAKVFKKTPHFSTLSGALEPLPKKPIAIRKPFKRDAQAKTKRPENVISTEKEDQSVEETVEKIRKLIIQHHKMHHQPLDYFSLILHPTKFGNTIENILHVSFLARDGVIQLKKDQSTGKLMIEPCTKEMAQHAKKIGKSSVQNIINLNSNQWQTLVKYYNITQPMINFTKEIV